MEARAIRFNPRLVAPHNPNRSLVQVPVYVDMVLAMLTPVAAPSAASTAASTAASARASLADDDDDDDKAAEVTAAAEISAGAAPPTLSLPKLAKALLWTDMESNGFGAGGGGSGGGAGGDGLPGATALKTVATALWSRRAPISAAALAEAFGAAAQV
jgi:hypothetical protein